MARLFGIELEDGDRDAYRAVAAAYVQSRIYAHADLLERALIVCRQRKRGEIGKVKFGNEIDAIASEWATLEPQAAALADLINERGNGA